MGRDERGAVVLEELRITNFALIDEVLIEFGPGLNVFTGETGAGKTILLQALGLLLGGRADTSVIRTGASESRVEARLRTNEGDGEVILARVVSREGKSKCYVDGSFVAVATLVEFGDRLADLHGQHEHQALLRVATHVDYLDRFCGAGQIALRRHWSEALSEVRSVERDVARLERFVAECRERRELLEFQAREIEDAALLPGEDEEIARTLQVLRNAERLASAAAGARELVAADEEESALELIRRAAAVLQGAEGVDSRLDGLRTRLEAHSYELEEAARELRAYAENVDLDQAALADAEERMALIADLKRKYGSTIEEVGDFASRAAEELSKLETASGEMENLVARRARLQKELTAIAAELRKTRVNAAARFEKRMKAELAGLSMGKAELAVRVEPRPASNGDMYGPTGADEVEFLFSPNVGEPAKPLARIGSGGEISRVMLAAKIVLGDADQVPMLVFDEIDSGIGGKTASAVGSKLHELAGAHQVICVTHLPQIAAVADRHFKVSKADSDGRTTTSVAVLGREDRVGEIARMLSGAKVSETSLEHAKEMLEGSA